MIYKTKYKIFLAIFLIAFLSSFLLSQGIGCTEACDLSQSRFLNKTVNGYAGMIIFAFMLLISYFQLQKPTKVKKALIHLGIIIGSAIALIFLYLQIFYFKAFCTYCMIIDIGLLICLGIIIFIWNQ